MNRLLVALAAVLSCGSFVVAEYAATDLPRRIDVNGHLLRMRVEGHGSPTVLLEVGIHGPLEVWAAVQRDVAQFTKVVSYDRLGSENGDAILPGSENARQFHAALTEADIRPPYILVAHSLGAMYARIFAAQHPDEVVGIVLLDPTQEQFFDWIDIHRPEKSPFKRTKNWLDGSSILQTFNEVKTSAALPDVPVVVVTGARRPPTHDNEESLLPIWTQMHDEWVNALPQGRHIVSEQCGHVVQVEQPQLVIDLIRAQVDRARQKEAPR